MPMLVMMIPNNFSLDNSADLIKIRLIKKRKMVLRLIIADVWAGFLQFFIDKI